MAFSLVTVHITEIGPLDGAAAEGIITFQLTAELNNAGVSAPRKIIQIPIVNGAGSVALYPNNDPGTTPTGTGYTVRKFITGAPVVEYAVILDHNTPVVTLADLAPATTITYFAYDAAGSAAAVLPGVTVTGTPSNGYVLIATGPNAATWGPQSGGGGTGITRTKVTVTAAVTLGAAALVDYLVLVSGSGAPTMPTAVSNTSKYTVMNIGISNIPLAFTGGQTINGTAGPITMIPGMSLDLFSDNANWRIA